MVDAGRGGTTFSLGSYKEQTNRIINLVYDVYGTYAKQLNDDFKLNTTLGFNSIDQANRAVAGSSVGGLVIPEFYDLTNSKRLQGLLHSLRNTGFSVLIPILLLVIKTGFLVNIPPVRTSPLPCQKANEDSSTRVVVFLSFRPIWKQLTSALFFPEIPCRSRFRR
ncbi:MAG: hypothetical protein IPL27_03980 [Lewinellaceae bacterium]|nr:hypothetical protein [Lewinellaceae bacterium]